MRRGLALTPEGRRVFPKLTVADNLRLGAVPQRDRDGRGAPAQRVFDLFPILQERIGQSAGTLSGGQQQMLAIGRSLMAGPRAAAARRAVARPGADPRRPDLRAHRPAAGRGHDDAAGRAERRTGRSRSPTAPTCSRTAGRARGPGRGAAAPRPRSSGPTSGSVSLDAPGRRRPGGRPADHQRAQPRARPMRCSRSAWRWCSRSSGSSTSPTASSSPSRRTRSTSSDQAGLPFWVQVPSAIVAAAIAAVLMERVAFRPLRGASFITLLFASFAISVIIQNIFLARSLAAAEGSAAPRHLQRGGPRRQLHDRVAADHHHPHLLRRARHPDALPAPLDPGARHAGRLAGLPGDAADGHPRQPGDRGRVRDLGSARGRRGDLHPRAARDGRADDGLHPRAEGVHRERHRRSRLAQRRRGRRVRARRRSRSASTRVLPERGAAASATPSRSRS